MSAPEVLVLIQEIIEKSANDDYIYRGEPEAHRKVASSLYRHYHDIDAEYFAIEEVQKEILDKARRYTSATDELEILAELQHYGGKTNLIDFTTDYHTALFFACDGFHDKDGRLILLKEATEQGQVWRPRNPANRVIAQKSVFVQPSKGFVEPDDVITIKKDLKQPMLNHLRKYHGIFTETIYNDLHGFIKNQGIHESAYTEFFRGLTSLSRGEEVKNKEEQRGYYEEAIMHYDAALTLNPNLAEAYLNRGNAKNALGHHEGAIADYDEALRLNLQFAEAYLNRGNAKQDLGRHKAAIADYDEALHLNPQFAVAYYNRGNAKSKLERHEAAIADYDEALRLNPQFAEAYSNRGNAKKALGHHEGAIADHDEALRLNPQLAEVSLNRGFAKQNLGRNEEANMDFQKFLTLTKQQGKTEIAKRVQEALDNLGAE